MLSIGDFLIETKIFFVSISEVLVWNIEEI